MLGKANLGAIIQGETVLDGTVWEGVITKGIFWTSQSVKNSWLSKLSSASSTCVFILTHSSPHRYVLQLSNHPCKIVRRIYRSLLSESQTRIRLWMCK